MTVYDAQATRALFAQYAGQGEDMVKKVSIICALNLYLTSSTCSCIFSSSSAIVTENPATSSCAEPSNKSLTRIWSGFSVGEKRAIG